MFELTIPAGSTRTDAVEVLNFVDAPTTFELYAAGTVTTNTGSLAPAGRESEITGVASWISLDQEMIDVPPRSSAIVEITVTVPEDAERKTHIAALLVEREPDTGGMFGVTTRVGLWVRITVTPGEGADPGGLGSWGVPWLPIAAVVFALLLWLAHVTRARRHRWLLERREELALVRDMRRRRHEAHGRGR
jgi:hypothetical protein